MLKNTKKQLRTSIFKLTCVSFLSFISVLFTVYSWANSESEQPTEIAVVRLVPKIKIREIEVKQEKQQVKTQEILFMHKNAFTPVIVFEKPIQTPLQVSYSGLDTILSMPGDSVFVRGPSNKIQPSKKYAIIRTGARLTDPDTKELLGYEVFQVGVALPKLSVQKELSSFTILSARLPVMEGDFLLPLELIPASNKDSLSIQKRNSCEKIIARVISPVEQRELHYGSVLAIDKGEKDGVYVGMSFNMIGQSFGEYAAESWLNRRQNTMSFLGKITVVKTFDNISYVTVVNTQDFMYKDTSITIISE